jgi:hypothetical protein
VRSWMTPNSGTAKESETKESCCCCCILLSLHSYVAKSNDLRNNFVLIWEVCPSWLQIYPGTVIVIQRFYVNNCSVYYGWNFHTVGAVFD